MAGNKGAEVQGPNARTEGWSGADLAARVTTPDWSETLKERRTNTGSEAME